MHYSRTLEAWLRLHDASRQQIMPLFEQTYGKQQVRARRAARCCTRRPAPCRCARPARMPAAPWGRPCQVPKPSCTCPQALKWFVYWRLFLMSCSELFRYDSGALA